MVFAAGTLLFRPFYGLFLCSDRRLFSSTGLGARGEESRDGKKGREKEPLYHPFKSHLLASWPLWLFFRGFLSLSRVWALGTLSSVL